MPVKRRRLAQRRKAVGFSQEGLAERLQVDRSTVVRWERGQTEPQPCLRPRLAAALQTSLDELAELITSPEPRTAEADDRLDHVVRNPRSVDLVVVAHLRERVEDLDMRYDRSPSTSLLASAGECLGTVTFLRSQAGRTHVRRQLLAVEASAATLMGQLVWDASQRRDHDTARTYLGQAVTAARELRDPAAEGLARMRAGFVALYGEKNPHRGLEVLAQAAAVSGHASQVVTGLAVLHTAEAHAMLGQRRECEQALGIAESQFEQVRGNDPAIDLFSSTQQTRVAGSCYLSLRESRRAHVILSDTARILSDRSKSQAIVLGNLALACVRQGNPDEAAAALHLAMDVAEATRGGGGLNVIFSVGRELKPWRHLSVVQEAHDRLLSLVAAA